MSCRLHAMDSTTALHLFVRRVGRLVLFLVIATSIDPSCAWAANADNGKRLAQSTCAACHVVAAGQRREVADAPPFASIAAKYASNAEMLASAILAPHPKMNFVPSRQEAEDLAAYIRSLAK
jgi:mono/diheme cytochrome c family protein